MSDVNEYVRYGSNGIFKVIDIVKRTSKEGVVEDWYQLESHRDGVATNISTPASNPLICPILSKKEIQHLIDEMPEIPSIWTEDKHERFGSFRTILDSNNTYKLVQLIKSIYFAKQKKESDGKKISDKDKEIFQFAEKLLFEEISVSYDIKKEDVMHFILSRVAE